MTRLTGWVLRRHPVVAVDPDRWREALHPACRSKAIRHDRTTVVRSGRRWRIRVRKCPYTLRSVGDPNVAVNTLRQCACAPRPRGSFKSPGIMHQPPCPLLGYRPQRVKSIHVQSVRCGRRVTRCRRRVPAPPVKIGKTRRSTDPNRAVMTRGKRKYGAGWEPILRSEMLQAARVPPSDPAEAIADPEPRAARRGKQRRHASCRAGLSLRRSERLKLKTIETNETRRAAQPQQAIVRLRERADFRWSSIADRPRPVI